MRLRGLHALRGYSRTTMNGQMGETVLDHLLSRRGVARVYERLAGKALPAVEVASKLRQAIKLCLLPLQ